MKCLVCYDISDNRKRRKAARYLESVAVRIEESVFLCDLPLSKLALVRQQLLFITAKDDGRRLLMVPLCMNCAGRMWMEGIPLEKEEHLIIA